MPRFQGVKCRHHWEAIFFGLSHNPMVNFYFQTPSTSQPHMIYMTTTSFSKQLPLFSWNHTLGFFLPSSHLLCLMFKCCYSLELSSGPSVLHILHLGNLIPFHVFKYRLYLLTPKYVSPYQASHIPMLQVYMCILLLTPWECLMDISNSTLFTNLLFLPPSH